MSNAEDNMNIRIDEYRYKYMKIYMKSTYLLHLFHPLLAPLLARVGIAGILLVHPLLVGPSDVGGPDCALRQVAAEVARWEPEKEGGEGEGAYVSGLLLYSGP